MLGLCCNLKLLYWNQHYKEKWLISCPYDPHNDNIFRRPGKITGTLGYGNIIILGYFNASVDEEAMKKIFTSHGLPGLIKILTCFNNTD